MADVLPEDMVFEILRRLPVKSLVKFTRVCKAWNSLIKDQAFISDYLDRTNQAYRGNGSLFLHLYAAVDSSSLYFDPNISYSLYSSFNQQTDGLSVEILPLSHLFERGYVTPFAGTCNGLVCYSDYASSNSTTAFIWNPSLRKYVVLPEPITPNEDDYVCFASGLGFDSRNNDYKVLRFVYDYSAEVNCVEVYSLVSRSWRSVNTGVTKYYRLDQPWWSSPHVFVNGAIHLVVRHCIDYDTCLRYILSFDVSDETFRELKLPQESSTKECWELRWVAVEGGNSLAVVIYMRVKFPTISHQWAYCNVWVMKEYGVAESWTQVLQCDRSHYGGILSILALTGNGKMLAHRQSGDLVLIDPIKGSAEVLGHQKFDVGVYAGSFVESLSLMNREDDVFLM